MTNAEGDHFCVLPLETIAASTGREFRAILGRVREASGLSCGQIAIRSGIHRSQVDSLGSIRRPRLPQNRDQVATYLECCRFDPGQTTIVLLLWDKLSGKQE